MKNLQGNIKSIFIFPLLTKLIIVMLMVLGGVLFVVIYQDSRIDLQNTLNILEQEGSRLIYRIESFREVLSFLQNNDSKTKKILYARLLQLLHSEIHVSYIELMNRKGQMVLHVGNDHSISHDDHIMFSLQNDQEVTHTYEDPQHGNLIFEIIEPIEPAKIHRKGETIGALRLGLFLDKVRARINDTRKAHFYNLSIFITTLFIIATIAFYILIARNNHIVVTRSLKDMEEKNRIIMEKMRHAERLATLGEFSAGIAHEIKNPLASIKNFTQLLPNEFEDPNFRKEFIALVTSEVNRIGKIVDDLLDYARPWKMNRQKVDFAKLIDEVLYSKRPIFNRQKIVVRKDYHHLLHAVIDPEQIRRAVLNLIQNSVEAMPKGGTLEITLRLVEEKEIEITISDTGSGIEEHRINDIFNPFVTTKKDGTGLGLAIVQRIIIEHQGSIAVTSNIHKGTRFVLRLPLERSPHEKDIDR